MFNVKLYQRPSCDSAEPAAIFGSGKKTTGGHIGEAKCLKKSLVTKNVLKINRTLLAVI